MENPHFITKQIADIIAEKKVRSDSPEQDYVIVPQQTLERDFGWVYFYYPRKYLETRNEDYLVPGAGPLAVMREDGSSMFLPTSVDLKTALETFEHAWRTEHTNRQSHPNN